MDDCRSDAELMECVRDQADPDAFAQLVCRWRPRLIRYFLSLLGSSAAADDAVQDVLLALWTQRADFHASGRFAAFMLRRAEHHWLNLRRREARRATEPLLEAHEPSQPASAQRRLEADEQQRRLTAATAALPSAQREVLRLVTDEALPEHDVARRLGVPVGTVKSRLYAARQRLRAALREIDDV